MENDKDTIIRQLEERNAILEDGYRQDRSVRNTIVLSDQPSLEGYQLMYRILRQISGIAQKDELKGISAIVDPVLEVVPAPKEADKGYVCPITGKE